MNPRSCVAAVILSLFGSFAGQRLAAAEMLDLKRETPVAATAQIPVQDFFRPSLLQQPSLNPSGTHIAAIVTAGEDRHELLVYELKSQHVGRVGAPDDRDIYDARWLNDHRLVFQLSARKMYGIGLLAVDVDDLNHAYPLLQYYSSSVVAVPPTDRLHPLIWNRRDGLDNAAQHDLGVAVLNTDIKTGQLRDLVTAGADAASVQRTREENQRHLLKKFPRPEQGIANRYLANRQGQLEFCVTMKDGVPTLYHLTGERWEKCPVDLDEIDLLSSGDEPGQLVVRGPRQPGKTRTVQFMDGVSGQLGSVLLQDNAYDFFGGGISDGWLYRDPVEHRIIGAVFERNGPEVVWFTESYRALQQILDGFFPGKVVRILGSDEAQKLFLVSTYTDRQPAEYQWVDLEKRTAGLFKRSAPWIDPARMQPMTPVKFKTRDGLRLDAYLTLPAGASKTNRAPLVVLSHGGPWARDTWHYDGEAQFLASRGYAVLQPNYRGSNGYGWMYPKSDEWDFAKMHTDVTDATKAIIASGYIDPNRIAIMGGSFGGYLAVSGVVNEPALYRCAITIAGVFDWADQINEKKYNQYDSSVFGYLMRKLGDPKDDPAKFDAISPGRHVEKIRVPVFVAAGKDDLTVDIKQSDHLISALEKFHVPHETYLVRDEGHGMAHLDKQVELYTRIEAFLAKNLAPTKTP